MNNYICMYVLMDGTEETIIMSAPSRFVAQMIFMDWIEENNMKDLITTINVAIIL